MDIRDSFSTWDLGIRVALYVLYEKNDEYQGSGRNARIIGCFSCTRLVVGSLSGSHHHPHSAGLCRIRRYYCRHCEDLHVYFSRAFRYLADFRTPESGRQCVKMKFAQLEVLNINWDQIQGN